MSRPFRFSKDFVAVDVDDDLARTLRKLENGTSSFVLLKDRSSTENASFRLWKRDSLVSELERLRAEQLREIRENVVRLGRPTLRVVLGTSLEIAPRIPSLPAFSVVTRKDLPHVSVAMIGGVPVRIVFTREPSTPTVLKAEGPARMEFPPAAAAGRATPWSFRFRKRHPPAMAGPPVESTGAMASVGERAEGLPGPPPPVFPSIVVSDEHPVQKATIEVDVSLEYDPDEATAGAVEVPDDGKQLLDVHLMAGEESRWGRLTFEHPNGTKEPARFEKVKVPTSEPDENGRVPENRLVEISVNFYLNGRWCGEGVRRIDVRSKADVSRLPDVPPPEAASWRSHLSIDPKAPPPDLLVRIKRLDEARFRWFLFSPHRSFAALGAEECTSSLGSAPYFFARDHFGSFSSAHLDDEAMTSLKASCDLIYGATPEGFRKAYWDLYLESRTPGSRSRLETIQFVSDEPFVPWELMRVSDDARAGDLAPEILGVRHAVGRWAASRSCELRHSLDVAELAVFATDYAVSPAVPGKLPWALEERKHLEKEFHATPHPVTYGEVVRFLDSGSAQAVHFSCHGRSNAQEAERATLQLEDKPIDAKLILRVEARRGVGRQKPFIFLNACQAAVAGEVLGLVFGWPQAFLQMGATACVAPLWNVVDETARDVAEEFYAAVLRAPDARPGPVTLGETLRVIRSHWEEKRSLTYLGYVLYGDPTATLTWHPAP